jgi:hypothetical protein
MMDSITPPRDQQKAGQPKQISEGGCEKVRGPPPAAAILDETTRQTRELMRPLVLNVREARSRKAMIYVMIADVDATRARQHRKQELV